MGAGNLMEALAAVSISGDYGERVLFAIAFGIFGLSCLAGLVILVVDREEREQLDVMTLSLAAMPTCAFLSLAVDAVTGPSLDGLFGYGMGVGLIAVALPMLIMSVPGLGMGDISIGMRLMLAALLLSTLFVLACGVFFIVSDATMTPEDIAKLPFLT